MSIIYRSHPTVLFILLFSLNFSQYIYANPPASPEEVKKELTAQKRLNYQTNLAKLEKYRASQKTKYANASTSQKKQILKQVKTKLETELTQNIFPAWYGTPWDFNGISNTPGKGKIACGYFVSTTLKHLGYNIPRIKLAQQASQKIIRTFMDRSAMDISSKRSLPKIKEQLAKSGNGIYIVGLDTHVGFVSVRDESITFIHSSYYTPDRHVKAEAYDSKNPLADSKYRVFGKFFHDQMLINWLYKKPYIVAR